MLGAAGCGPGVVPREPPLIDRALARRSHPPGPARRFACVDRNVLRASRRIVPLLEYLERRTGRRIEMAYFADHESQLEALLAGRADYAWISPTGYVLARQKLAITPLVRPIQDTRTTYRSVLVVREDHPAGGLEDLRGRHVLFVRPESTSGNVFPRSFLAERGMDPEKSFSQVEYSGSHYQSLFAVARGKADAAFVEDGSLETAERDLKVRFRVLETVARIPHGPIAVHPAVPAEEVEEIRGAFAAYDTDPLNTPLVHGLQKATGIQAFKASEDEDYEDVRRHVLRHGVAGE